MRFDTLIFLQCVIPGAYDSNTGNYGKDTITEVPKWANVTDAGTDTLKLLYGTIRQGVKTIRLQRCYDDAFDFIRIGDKRYQVDFSRNLMQKQVFTVSEVQ